VHPEFACPGDEADLSALALVVLVSDRALQEEVGRPAEGEEVRLGHRLTVDLLEDPAAQRPHGPDGLGEHPEELGGLDPRLRLLERQHRVLQDVRTHLSDAALEHAPHGAGDGHFSRAVAEAPGDLLLRPMVAAEGVRLERAPVLG
jgi:hypothetical protein